MNKMKRFLPVLALAFAFSGQSQANPCEIVTIPPLPTIPCEFLGFTNTPISSSLFLNLPSGNLVVCNQLAPLGTEWGVAWQVPSLPDRTGHEDWDDLGDIEQEPTTNPDDLDNGRKLVTSNAKYSTTARGSATESETLTVQTFMRDIVDTALDCDGPASTGGDLGNCAVLNEDAPLVAVTADNLDFEKPFGTADGNVLCTDSMFAPTNIVVDNNDDCSDGAGGLVLLGQAQNTRMFQVNGTWAFESAGNAGLLEAGEDLYRDVRPAGLFRANDSVVMISTGFETIGATSVAYQIFENKTKENRDQPTRTLQGQDPTHQRVQVEEWPVFSGFSRFLFGNSADDLQTVNFTLPSGEEVQGQILAIVPQGDNLRERTDEIADASFTERNTTAEDSNRGAQDVCPNNYFVVVGEGLEGDQQVDSNLVVPTLSQWVLMLLATILMLGGAYTLRS